MFLKGLLQPFCIKTVDLKETLICVIENWYTFTQHKVGLYQSTYMVEFYITLLFNNI